MKHGIYEDEEIVQYLTENYPGDSFKQHLNDRLNDFENLPEDEKVLINPKSLNRAKSFASLPLACPGIFLIGNGNIRFLFMKENENFGVQILDNNLQIVHI